MAEPSSLPTPAPAPESLSLAVGDSWTGLRRFTAARIALGRTGGSQPTRSVLDFRLSHARARDAVRKEFSPGELLATYGAAGIAARLLSTRVADRRTHLLRPDLGRMLDDSSHTSLLHLAGEIGPVDLVVVVSDGLAAAAAERHSLNVLKPLFTLLSEAGWRLAPVLVAPFARVKVQDEIGELLGAKFSLILLGERPGLGAPDSLGAYLTANPSASCTDADRNCVSNIRPEGIPPGEAASKLAWLLIESARTGLRGIHLKDMGEGGSLQG